MRFPFSLRIALSEDRIRVWVADLSDILARSRICRRYEDVNDGLIRGRVVIGTPLPWVELEPEHRAQKESSNHHPP